MKKYNQFIWGVARVIPLSILLLLMIWVVPSPVKASGGIAISGSFYRQNFEIPQGSSVSGPSIYIVILNNGSEEVQVRMSWDAPLGVNINLSEEDFVLKPADQQKVLIGVDVTSQATPGNHLINITAESYKQESEGIQLMGAVGQSADLIVLGDSASVTVQTMSPGKEPMMSIIRLFKVINNENFEVGYSDNGKLEAKVSPGSFVASSYVGGNTLAEEAFQLATGEEKTITLTLATVFFEDFDIIPSYVEDTEDLAFVELVYTINNLYQKLPGARVLLEVTHKGSIEDEVEIMTIDPMETGRVGLRYNYQPKTGWKEGSYVFRLNLYVDGKIYILSHEEALDVVKPSAIVNPPTNESNSAQSSGIQRPVIVGIVAGSIIFMAIIALLVKRQLIKG